MAIDGGTPLLTDIVEGVPDGATVHIAHPDLGRRVDPSHRWWLDGDDPLTRRSTGGDATGIFASAPVGMRLDRRPSD